jgi:type II secretory pathway component PulC
MQTMKHSGVLIHEIIGTSLTELAKFKKIDFIQTIEGHTFKSKDEAFNLLGKLTKHGAVNITVSRDGELLTLKL